MRLIASIIYLICRAASDSQEVATYPKVCGNVNRLAFELVATILVVSN